MPRGAGRRPSMTDVGRLAGVSAQTVSRYFNDGYVSGEARERVEAAVNELGYVRNRLPVQLRATQTNMIGVVLLGPLNYGNTSIMTGLYRAARELGQTVMTTHMAQDPAGSEELMAQVLGEVDGFLSMRVDALVLASPYPSLAAVAEHVGSATAVVTIAELDDDASDAVGGYSYDGARTVVEHLLALGHRRILHVAGPLDRQQARARLRGYRDGLAAAGLAPLPALEAEEWDARSGEQCARRAPLGDFSAVFAGNDEIALGFMTGLARRGRRAPEDYVIAGFDDMPDARFLMPALTTARVDFEAVGEAGLVAAVARAGGRESSRPRVRAELVVRESTAGGAAPSRRA